MLRIRVITAGAIVLMTAGAAAAQSDEASGTAPGKPISLLQILLKPAGSQPAQDEHVAQAADEQAQPVERRTHRRVAHRHKWTRHYTHRKIYDEDATAAQTPEPAPAATPEAQASDTANTPAAFGQAKAAAFDQPTTNPMVADSHTAQAAAADQVSATDAVAGSTLPPWPQAIAAPPQDNGVTKQPDTAAQPVAQEQHPMALDQPPEIQPVATASAVQPDEGTDRNRDRWYENLLATLSGAFVAASVAWIVIGLSPPRRSRAPMLTYETESMRRWSVRR